MISDSTALIFLAKIRKLGLLKQLYRNIVIPRAVKEEIFTEGKTEVLAFQEVIEEGWIKIKDPKKDIYLNLGKGENAAINLAKENKESLIIDDLLGFKIAQSLGVDCLRTTTLLFKATEKRIMNKREAFSLLNKLIEAGYYIAPQYYVALAEKLSK